MKNSIGMAGNLLEMATSLVLPRMQPSSRERGSNKGGKLESTILNNF